MNITVKAPPGGILSSDGQRRYDVDIQKVKERYENWRRRIVTGGVTYYLLYFLWFVLWGRYLYPEQFHEPVDSLQSLLRLFGYALWFFIATWQGWVLLGSMILVMWLREYFINKRTSFQCPFDTCNEEILVNEPWQCLYCRNDVNVNYPKLFRTFFDKCKNGHKPESYQCPACNGVFELIPNGRKNKPAKRANLPVVHQSYLVPPEQPGTDEFF